MEVFQVDLIWFSQQGQVALQVVCGCVEGSEELRMWLVFQMVIEGSKLPMGCGYYNCGLIAIAGDSQ
jgi:hypothetical protein